MVYLSQNQDFDLEGKSLLFKKAGSFFIALMVF